jgi:ribosomal protein S27AE
MLIVGCQVCGESKVLAGAPDDDGVARVQWTCPRCGAGQVLQLEVSGDARGGDLRKILGGLALLNGDKNGSDAVGEASDGLRAILGGQP